MEHDRTPGSRRYALETSVASMVDIGEKLKSLGLDTDAKAAGQRLAEELVELRAEPALCRRAAEMLTTVVNLRAREQAVEVMTVERDANSEVSRTIKRMVQPEMQATAEAFGGFVGVLISHCCRTT